MAALLLALVAGWIWGFCPAAESVAAPLRDAGAPRPVMLSQTDPKAQPGAGNQNPDPTEEPWRERLERVERNQLIAVGIFLGVVLLALLFWWGRGKLYQRPRKL
ncbi:MAG: hypothetical protein JW889_12445 [Verrucomicrobia bacterium]|nr:hypothetical protein [Verrucomicrobiota bacterium]